MKEVKRHKETFVDIYEKNHKPIYTYTRKRDGVHFYKKFDTVYECAMYFDKTKKDIKHILKHEPYLEYLGEKIILSRVKARN